MSSRYFDWLKTAWSHPTNSINGYTENWITSPHRRLIKALSDGNAKSLDLASLVRSVVRFEEINNPEKLITLTIPKSIANTISKKNFEQVSIDIIKETSSEIIVKARNWNPKWLPGIHLEAPDQAGLEDKIRRNDNSVTGDPILRHLGFKNYRSIAQREAVRSVLCAQPGDTLALNLPTGSGKSLAAFLPALLYPSADEDHLGVTLVIVPTVSLALDMASKIEPVVGHKVAYRPNEEEAENIRIRCRRGLQGPIIVSPESLVGALRTSILDASENGYLRYFVIDEAHMVLSWGDEFRPAFQQVTAIRNEMLRKSKSRPFVTILMSATFTEYHLRWLKRMFAGENRFTVIHAARLRPEPSFWQAEAPTKPKRFTWVLDAILHFPKPLIVYTAQRKSTKSWFKLLQNEGFARIAMIHGGTSNNDRKVKIANWNKDEIDIMIATSAFGLGVDKPDIRSIIHAELPETVDRFYQDVGRGGRDGFGSISLICWCKYDRKIIKRLQNPSFIGPKKGLKRWTKMFNQKKTINPVKKIYQVSLNTPAEIDMQNEMNRLWNIRTLLLLERSGLIKLEFTKTTDPQQATIKILQEGHTLPETWNNKVETIRKELKREYRKSSLLLERLIASEECPSHIFSDCYTSNLFNVSVVRACGGCHKCRQSKIHIPHGKILARRFPEDPFRPGNLSRDFKLLMGGNKVLSIFYPDKLVDSKYLIEKLVPFIYWLLDREIINIIGFPELTGWLFKRVTSNRHWRFFLHDRLPNDVTQYFPTVLFIAFPLPQWWNQIWSKIDKLSTETVIVMPKNLSAPDHQMRFVRDVVEGKKINLDVWEDQYLE